ncbi:MAG: hypothetical protein ACRDK4_03500 [Solirubrobacteraceae bacterium]
MSLHAHYAWWDGCEDCQLAAFQDITQQASQAVHESLRTATTREQHLALGLRALLRFCENHPDLARFAVIDTITSESPSLRRRRQQELHRLTRILAAERSAPSTYHDTHHRPPRRTARLIAAESNLLAALSAVHRALQPNSTIHLRDLAEPLAALLSNSHKTPLNSGLVLVPSHA